MNVRLRFRPLLSTRTKKRALAPASDLQRTNDLGSLPQLSNLSFSLMRLRDSSLSRMSEFSRSNFSWLFRNAVRMNVTCLRKLTHESHENRWTFISNHSRQESRASIEVVTIFTISRQLGRFRQTQLLNLVNFKFASFIR